MRYDFPWSENELLKSKLNLLKMALGEVRTEIRDLRDL